MEKFIPFSSEFTFSHIWLTVPDAMLITLVVYIIVRLLWLRKMRLSRTILCGAPARPALFFRLPV